MNSAPTPVRHKGHLKHKVNYPWECYALIDNVFDKTKQQNIHYLFTMRIKNIIYCIELRAENVSPHTGLVSKVVHLKLFYITLGFRNPRGSELANPMTRI